MTSRNQSLDVLRCIAIVLVLGRHSVFVKHNPYLSLWYKIGWSGVDLFFVLSGFLISGLLFREFKQRGAIDVKRFWIRRAFKIYPAYYVLLAITVVIVRAATHQFPQSVLGDAFFLANYLPHFWIHTWSLAVEEHFYLVLPLLVLLLSRLSSTPENPFRWIPGIALALAVACLLLRTVTVQPGLGWEQTYPTHLRIDGLLFGVMLAYYKHFETWHWNSRMPTWAVGAILLVVGLYPISPLFTATIGLTLTFVGFGCLLMWVLESRILEARWLRPLAWLGACSYSIYLWHALVASVLKERTTAFEFTAYITLSLLVGAGMAKLVEVPSLAIRDRLFPSHKIYKPDFDVEPLTVLSEKTAPLPAPSVAPTLLVPLCVPVGLGKKSTVNLPG